MTALLTGIGAGRAHRFQVFARMARALSERGIASVRLDWEGVGDSTGSVDAWTMAHEEALLDQATTTLRMAASATGTTHTALVGNCFGARIALIAGSREPDCLGSACLLPLMAPSAPQQAFRRASNRSFLAAVRRNKLVRRFIVRRLKNRSGLDKTARAAIEGTLSHGHLLLLYGEDDHALTGRMREQMHHIVQGMRPEQATHYEMRVLPVSRMAGFDSLETQRLSIEAVVDWLDSLFPTADGADASMIASVDPESRGATSRERSARRSAG